MNKEYKLMVSDDLNLYIFKTYLSRGITILNPEYEIWFAWLFFSTDFYELPLMHFKCLYFYPFI